MTDFKSPNAYATRGVIGLCIAAYVLMLLGGPAVSAAIGWDFGLIPARITAAIQGRADILSALVSFITFNFLHWDLIHLAINMAMIALLGRDVEWRLGRGGLVALFLLGGIIGGAAQVLAMPSSMGEIRGASGGGAAILAAYAMLFGKTKVADKRLLGLRVPGALLAGLWYATTWILLQFGTGLAFDTPGHALAIWSHIGGFLAGMALARPLSRPLAQ